MKFQKGHQINEGRILSAEHKKKISEANKKMFFSEEHRRKIRESKLGKKHTAVNHVIEKQIHGEKNLTNLTINL